MPYQPRLCPLLSAADGRLSYQTVYAVPSARPTFPNTCSFDAAARVLTGLRVLIRDLIKRVGLFSTRVLCNACRYFAPD